MQRYEATLTAQVLDRVVVDPVMKPGQIATTVEVAAITPMVVTDNPTVGSTLEHRRIEQLPLNGRTVITLFNTVPGMEGFYPLRAYGAATGTADVILDGSSEIDRRWGNPPGIDGTPSSPPGLDSVQEFTVQTNAVSAKMSRPTNIILSTKSGTNQFHGSAFWTNRNNGYGVARARTDYYTKPPQLNRNEFGISGGGPVVIPKVYNGKNRTFIFLSWEAFRMIQGITGARNVPTAAMRNGDFSELKDSLGRLQVLYDPLTTAANNSRQPFSYGGKLNAIDPARMSSAAKYLFGVTPDATTSANPLVDTNMFAPVVRKNRTWTFSSRIDHKFGDNDQMYVRTSYTDLSYIFPENSGGGFEMKDGLVGWEKNTNFPKSIAVSWVHTFTPTLFNELLASAHRDQWTGGAFDDGTNWPNKLGVPSPFGDKLFPRFLDLGFGNLAYQNNATKMNNNSFFILDDNATKIRGKHEMQFGFHGRRDIMNIIPDQMPYPFSRANTLATALYDPASTPTNPIALPQTGYGIANFYLGYLNYEAKFQHRWYYLRTAEYALYFQDNWKVTPRLTLNLGLRWEYWPAFHEKNDSFAGLDVPSHAIVTGKSLSSMYALGSTLPSIVARYQALGMTFKTAADVGLPPSLMYPNKKNFAPRAGFAYRAFAGKKQFVIRGGYSLAYSSPPTYTWLDSNRGNPPSEAMFSWSGNAADQSPDGLANYWLRSTPVYIQGVNSSNAIRADQPKGITRGSASLNYFAPEQPDQRTHTWNVSIEKDVMAETMLSVRYVGNHNSNIPQRYSFNDNTPDYVWYVTQGTALPSGDFANVARRYYDQTVLGSVTEYRKVNYSNFNGMEFELQRRYSEGYAFQVFYVVGNAMAINGSTTAVNQYLPGTVPADFTDRMKLLQYARDTSIPKHRVRG
ncbi:MAG: TonB-dependent receptor, partial [Acidobacteria bacterium]|nr:TonB-dependent receptor [Acidobacteriota bacterium]